MATVIIAIVVFGLIGLDVWYIVRNTVNHTGKLGCAGCAGCSECAGYDKKKGHSGGCDGRCGECTHPCGGK